MNLGKLPVYIIGVNQCHVLYGGPTVGCWELNIYVGDVNRHQYQQSVILLFSVSKFTLSVLNHWRR